MTDHLHALPPGHRLGEYRMEYVLGSGGFGITYYAWDLNLDKPVGLEKIGSGQWRLHFGRLALGGMNGRAGCDAL